MSLFTLAFYQAGESSQKINDFKQMCQSHTGKNGWKFPSSFHVTTLYVGGDKDKMSLPQAEHHLEGKDVTVEIRAIIYIPGKLVAGITFPDSEIENEFPHMTLMVSQGWAPKLSNDVIQATCGHGSIFEQAYIAAKDGKRPVAGKGVYKANNIAIDKKGQNEVVFVLLKYPISFNGFLKSYY